MGRKQAIAALRANLITRFGANVQDLIDREIASMVETHPTIQIEDLDKLELTLTQAVGGRQRNLSNTHTPRPEGGRQVPLVTQLTPVTSGKRRLAGASPNPLFPRLDGFTPTLRPSPPPHRNITPDAQALRVRSKRWDERKEDQWGRVLQWDAAKFHHEETLRRQAKDQLKSWYRHQLDSQVQQKAQNTDRAHPKDAETGLLFPSNLTKKTPIRRLNSAYEEMISLHKTEVENNLKTKHTEKLILEENLARENEEKAAKDRSRYIHFLAVKEENMQVAKEKQLSKRAKEAVSRERERIRLEKDREFDYDSLWKQNTLKRIMLKEISEENKTVAFEGRRERGSEVSPGVVEDRERSKSVKREKQEKIAMELGKQVAEQARRKEEWREVQREQAEMWRKEQMQDLTAQREKQVARRELQKQLRAQLDSQVEEKTQRLELECQFTRVEQQLNRELLQAVSECR